MRENTYDTFSVPSPWTSPTSVVMTAVVAEDELLDITGSNSLPMTPATTLRLPADLSVTWIVTSAPVQGQVTVVEGSQVAAIAAQPAEDAAALNVTAGWTTDVKTTVTVAPVEPVPAT